MSVSEIRPPQADGESLVAELRASNCVGVRIPKSPMLRCAVGEFIAASKQL